MDTHGHETVARLGRDVLATALARVGRQTWSLQAFYLGNWLTDVSQAIDPVAYASFKKKAAHFARVLRLIAGWLREAATLPLVSGLIGGLLVSTAASLDNAAQVIEDFSRMLDVGPGRTGEVADLLRKAMKAKGYFKFAHPEKKGRPARMKFAIYKHVFTRNFTQYYPHEHLDRFPAELDQPRGWPGGGYAAEVAGATRTPDLRPGTGSAVSPHLYRYLVDDIEIGAGLLASIDQEWARFTFTARSSKWSPEDPEWHRWLADLGHALHAFEDFFAHSNFVEHALHGLSNRDEALKRLGFGTDPTGQSPYEVFQRRLTRLRGHRVKKTWIDQKLEEAGLAEPGGPEQWQTEDVVRADEAHVVTGYFDFCDTFFSLRHVVEELFGGGKSVEGKVTAVRGQGVGAKVEIDLGASSRVRMDSRFTVRRAGTLKVVDLDVLQLREGSTTLRVTSQYVTGLDPQVGDVAYLRSSSHEAQVDQGEEFAALLRFLCLGELQVQRERGTAGRSVTTAEVKRDLDPLVRLISGVAAAPVSLPGLTAGQVAQVEHYLLVQDPPESRDWARNGAQRVLELPADAGEIRDDLYDVVAGYCQRKQAGGATFFERSLDAIAALDFLLGLNEYCRKYLFAGLPEVVRKVLEERISKPMAAMIDSFLGRYRIGCHSLLAKDYEWDNAVLDQLYVRARNLARAVHWYAVTVLTRWSNPAGLPVCRATHDASGTMAVNTADCREWVDWHEFFEFFLRHPHGQPVNSNLPRIAEKDRWWYPILMEGSDLAWQQLPLYPTGKHAVYGTVLLPKPDLDELIRCRNRMKPEAEKFYDGSLEPSPPPPPKHTPHKRGEPSPAPAPNPAPAPGPAPALGPGPGRQEIPAAWLPDHEAVRLLQTHLTLLGHSPGEIDGDWGPNTRAGLISFQRAHPPLKADGVYGPKTQAALDRAVNG